MTVHRMNLGWGELFSFFFKKKVCKECRVKLERFKETEDMGDGFHVYSKGPLSFGATFGHRYEHTIKYRCPKCEKVYSLEDL